MNDPILEMKPPSFQIFWILFRVYEIFKNQSLGAIFIFICVVSGNSASSWVRATTTTTKRLSRPTMASPSHSATRCYSCHFAIFCFVSFFIPSQSCCNPDFQNESEETGAEANPIVVDDEDPFVTVESRVFVRWFFPHIIGDSFWREADY